VIELVLGDITEQDVDAIVNADPVEHAAPVAIRATQEALAAHPSVAAARFVFRDEATLGSYRAALDS
jgi:O-acetyl-ADP-ribose deacetylase (regulator of RNase III)